MAHILIGPLLRHVSGTSATIWVEVDEPCGVTVLGHSTQTFTVFDHHYALVIVEGLTPGTTVPYTVELDGQVEWPPSDSTMPPSTIRLLGDHSALRILFGSCRASAPHEPPYSLEPGSDPRQRGSDALRAHGLRMLEQPVDDWPDLVVFLGDQVYADDPSPLAQARMRDRRREDSARPVPPAELVADFEEYTWLYRDAWTPDIERWVLSVVPSTMIFDDHDMVDDWNISIKWVTDIRNEAWWQEHIIGGLVSYWVYQHLGNLSPDRISEEGLLAQAVAAGDAGDLLRAWAMSSEEFTPVAGGYVFSFVRHLGDVRLVVVDSRNGRTLAPGERSMIDSDESAWIAQQCEGEIEHLVIATSLPVFVPGGLHGLQQWNEALCDGVWGRNASRASERVRRALDLEDWAAFDRSFRWFVALLTEVSERHNPPSTITILSGDIHFSYVARVVLPSDSTTCQIHQVVSSPIRNSLKSRERRVLMFSISRAGLVLGRWLQRSARRPISSTSWELIDGPLFRNGMGMLECAGRTLTIRLERASSDCEGRVQLETVAERTV